jgi:hypothetical protein
MSHLIETIDEEEEERSTEENLFLIAQVTGRPYAEVLKEHNDRESYMEFWNDPCWANDN